MSVKARTRKKNLKNVHVIAVIKVPVGTQVGFGLAIRVYSFGHIIIRKALIIR